MSLARLSDFKTAWNVSSRIDEGRKLGRIALRADGVRFEGIVVPLGLERAVYSHTIGTLFAVSQGEIAMLDEREFNYERIDVTNSVRWLSGARPRQRFRVYTYMPQASSVYRLQSAAKSGMQIAISKAYVDALERAVEMYRASVAITIPALVWPVVALTISQPEYQAYSEKDPLA